MGNGPDHEALLRRGAELHEARRYKAALLQFDRAADLAPQCLVARYERANTLHMLGRDQEAYGLLRSIVATPTHALRANCCADPGLRSLKLDSYMLLFWVVLHGRGFCKEAFAYASAHLRRRQRGVRSVWTKREAVSDIARMKREWMASE